MCHLTPDELSLLLYVLDHAGEGTRSHRLLEWRAQIQALRQKIFAWAKELYDDTHHS